METGENVRKSKGELVPVEAKICARDDSACPLLAMMSIKELDKNYGVGKDLLPDGWTNRRSRSMSSDGVELNVQADLVDLIMDNAEMAFARFSFMGRLLGERVQMTVFDRINSAAKNYFDKEGKQV